VEENLIEVLRLLNGITDADTIVVGETLSAIEESVTAKYHVTRDALEADLISYKDAALAAADRQLLVASFLEEFDRKCGELSVNLQKSYEKIAEVAASKLRAVILPAAELALAEEVAARAPLGPSDLRKLVEAHLKGAQDAVNAGVSSWTLSQDAIDEVQADLADLRKTLTVVAERNNTKKRKAAEDSSPPPFVPAAKKVVGGAVRKEEVAPPVAAPPKKPLAAKLPTPPISPADDVAEQKRRAAEWAKQQGYKVGKKK